MGKIYSRNDVVPVIATIVVVTDLGETCIINSNYTTDILLLIVCLRFKNNSFNLTTVSLHQKRTYHTHRRFFYLDISTTVVVFLVFICNVSFWMIRGAVKQIFNLEMRKGFFIKTLNAGCKTITF